MIQLNNPITIRQPPYTGPDGKVVTPDPVTYSLLDVTYIIRPGGQTIYAQIAGIPSPIALVVGNDFSSLSNNLNLSSLEELTKAKLGDDPQSFLQSLFPKTLESDPNGPGSVLSGMIATLGIKAAPNCSCKRHAIEMNEKGPDWCEQNMDTILSWLKEESTKRKLPFIESVARLVVQRAIKTSRRLKAKE